jgi:plasmid stabilization system protein ParE
MAKRKVVWTISAEIQLQSILDFFNNRNKNANYSRRLYKNLIKVLRTVEKNPELGIKTKIENIRGLIIDDYILFYEISETMILVLKIWDSRQNPNKLDIVK